MSINTPLMRLLSGMEPDKFDTNKLNINGEGCWADYDGSRVWSYRTQDNGMIQVDMATVGLNGRDQGGAPGTGSDWYLYLCANPSTGHQGAVVSRSITYDGVVFPSGYTSVRKLPFGFIYRADWDGIPNFHVPAFGGIITFTDSEDSAKWRVLVGGRSSSWQTISLAGWLPDNARVAYLDIETRDAGLACAGSAYIRSHGGQTSGVLCGSTSPTQPFVCQSRLIRVDSTRNIQYVVTGGAALYIRAAGYLMTEPS